MPIQEIIEEVLSNNEFGKPWKWSDKAAGLLVPVLRTGEIFERQYVMLEEAKDKVSIEDTGHIGEAKLINKAGIFVFVRGGGILEGKTQTRAVQTGTILKQGKQEIPINCVHATLGIVAGAAMGFSANYAPRKVASALRRKNQSEVWSAVSDYHTDMWALAGGSAGGSASAQLQTVAPDDLAETVRVANKFKGDVEDAIKRMPREKNQVGVVIFDLQGVVGIEVFDHPDSWKALCENVIRQYGETIQQQVPDYLSINPDKIAVNIREFMEQAKESKEEPEKNGTVILHGKISGEYTIMKPKCDDDRINGFVQSFGSATKLIHLLLTREEEQQPQPQPRLSLSGYMAERERARRSIEPQTPGPQPQEQTMGITFPYYTTSGSTSDLFFRHRDAVSFLNELSEKPKTWHDLEPQFKSTNTLNNLIHSAMQLDLVAKSPRQTNGKPEYTLTARGHEELRKKHSIEAQTS
jgi:hypothetical protein